METSEVIIENLRQALLSHIRSNEKVNAKFQKIINMLMVVIIALSTLTLAGVIFSNYIIIAFSDKTDAAMQRIERFNKTSILQQNLNQAERKDIAVTRSQLAPFIKMQDSTLKAKDSIINKAYKKAIK